MNADQCRKCGATSVAPVGGRCPWCGSDSLESVTLSPTGLVDSVTTVRLAPPGVEIPYTLAYADFAPNAKLIARVSEEVVIGATVAIEPADSPAELFRFVPVREG